MGEKASGHESPLSYDHWSPDALSSDACRAFRRKYYAAISDGDWNDWRWQLRNRLRTIEEFSRILELSPDEQTALREWRGPLPAAVTPYYAHLITSDGSQGLRKTHVPSALEWVAAADELLDPLEEDAQTPVPGLVHRYPDRVLFLATGSCATYCRYCTRSRMVGDPGGPYSFSLQQWETAIAYIAAHSEIRDVLVSGGDPLILATEKLDWLLSRLRRIPHIEFIRIGTKIPIVLPQRITSELADVLRKDLPIWLSVHVVHANELTPEADLALARLADAGLPLGSQTVLLKGVNDDVPTMRALMHRLLRARVRPYYLYQCDPILGSAHFRTPLARGPEIIDALRGHTTGYAVPTFVVDTPRGKVPLTKADLQLQPGNVELHTYGGHIFTRAPEVDCP